MCAEGGARSEGAPGIGGPWVIGGWGGGGARRGPRWRCRRCARRAGRGVRERRTSVDRVSLADVSEQEHGPFVLDFARLDEARDEQLDLRTDRARADGDGAGVERHVAALDAL